MFRDRGNILRQSIKWRVCQLSKQTEAVSIGRGNEKGKLETVPFRMATPVLQRYFLLSLPRLLIAFSFPLSPLFFLLVLVVVKAVTDRKDCDSSERESMVPLEILLEQVTSFGGPVAICSRKDLDLPDVAVALVSFLAGKPGDIINQNKFYGVIFYRTHFLKCRFIYHHA